MIGEASLTFDLNCPPVASRRPGPSKNKTPALSLKAATATEPGRRFPLHVAFGTQLFTFQIAKLTQRTNWAQISNEADSFRGAGLDDCRKPRIGGRSSRAGSCLLPR